MFWRKSIIFAVDCLAVLAAVAMAAPFVLIFVSPFIGGLGGWSGLSLPFIPSALTTEGSYRSWPHAYA